MFIKITICVKQVISFSINYYVFPKIEKDKTSEVLLLKGEIGVKALAFSLD